MDKSMIPILVAMAMIVAAGAVLAIYGGGTEDGREPPSGYPPGLDGPENEQVNPIEPEDGPYGNNKSIRVSTDRTVITRGEVFTITVHVTNMPLEKYRISLPEGFSYEVDIGSDPRTMPVTITPPRDWTGSFIMEVTVSGLSAECHLMIIPPEGVPGASVPGALPALETFLVLRPGNRSPSASPPSISTCSPRSSGSRPTIRCARRRRTPQRGRSPRSRTMQASVTRRRRSNSTPQCAASPSSNMGNGPVVKGLCPFFILFPPGSHQRPPCSIPRSGNGSLFTFPSLRRPGGSRCTPDYAQED